MIFKTVVSIKNNKGFTVIELVIVIAILGILTAMAIPKINKPRENAAITTHNANVRILESAANMYIADEGFPNEKVEWPNAKTYMDYLEEWPNVPDGLSKKKYKSSLDTEIEIGTTKDYKVVIECNGTIKVTPGKIISKKSN